MLNKQMQQTKQTNIFQFLLKHELTEHAAERLKQYLNFELEQPLLQRKLTEFGIIISRVTGMNMVIKLAASGFQKELIDNALINIQQEISALLGNFRTDNLTDYVDGYTETGSWFDCFSQTR
jgi:hypothetical protein